MAISESGFKSDKFRCSFSLKSFLSPALLPILALMVTSSIGSSIPSRRGSRALAYRGINYNLRDNVQCPTDQNGQFSHPMYCDMYLNCWNGDVVVSQCSNGLLFNPNNSVCDFPDNVDCEGREDSRPPTPLSPDCPKPFGTFASSTNCSEFVVCQGGNSTTYTCPDGLLYNDALGVCTYAYDAYCIQLDDENQSPPGSSPTLVPVINPSSPSSVDESTLKPSPTTSQKPGNPPPPSSPSLPVIEPPDSIEHIFWPMWPNEPTMRCPVVQGIIPVLGECEAFVVCLGGLGQLIRCPTGHAFDVGTGRCGPIRITEGCLHHQFPDGDDEALRRLIQSGRISGKVKYLYLPIKKALSYKLTKNLNL